MSEESLSIERFRTQKDWEKKKKKRNSNVFAEESQPHKTAFGLVPRAKNVWRRREDEFERNSFFGFAFSNSLLSIIITQIFKTIKKKKEGVFLFKPFILFYGLILGP